MIFILIELVLFILVVGSFIILLWSLILFVVDPKEFVDLAFERKTQVKRLFKEWKDV